MKTHSCKTRHGARGFTLIELMVAMGITAVIVTVLVSITSVATDTWTRSRSEIRASRQAKVMLDTMARDLESFVSRKGDNIEWLIAKMEASDFPKVATDQESTGAAAKLIFMTAATDRYAGQIGDSLYDKGGDISCVGYTLKYKDPITGDEGDDNSTFVLYRNLVNPDETFQNLLGKEALDTAFSQYDTDSELPENFICENVHQFTLTFQIEVPRTQRNKTVNETVRVAMSSDQTSGEFSVMGTGLETTLNARGITADELAAGRLSGVEISISVLTDGGLAKINAAERGLSEDEYAQNVYHYSRIVEVPGM